MNEIYLATARLLAEVAPIVFEGGVFALKGGTAINLFIREMPRLSVDLDLVFIWDLDCATGAVAWSEILEAQYGLQPGTFPGTFEAFIAHIHPDDRSEALAAIQAAYASGSDFTVHHRSIWPDGTVRWLSGAGRVYLDAAGKPVRGHGISLDVTERHTLDDQYLQALKMEAVGRLASGVAHDFNNLLTVILGFAELVTADESLGTQHTRDLAEIVKAAKSASVLTRQLLAFSRQQVLHAAPLDINALLTTMGGMLQRLIGEHITITLELSPAVPLAIVDRGQLEQVVMNLVVNARDAMAGGGELTLSTATVTLAEGAFGEKDTAAGRYVHLAIRDTGMGMDRETQRRLFEPFFTTKEIGKGTGLGLSTTYGIVKQSKGHIAVDSSPGDGATFHVYLPCSSSDVSAPTPIPAVAVAAIARATETILLVEDEAGVRYLSRRILEGAGYVVIEAAGGDQAEQLFAEYGGRIDLVVTDVVMPGCGGPELVARLQLHVPALRVLYMSGYTEQATAHRAGIDQGIPFVEKPFTAADFARCVREALDR